MMFTSKKDTEIEALQSENETLQNQLATLTSEVKFNSQGWLDCRIESEKMNTEVLIVKNKMSEMQDYYNNEIARLRRMITSEKTRRMNNKNANERRIRKLTKVIEEQ